MPDLLKRGIGVGCLGCNYWTYDDHWAPYTGVYEVGCTYGSRNGGWTLCLGYAKVNEKGDGIEDIVDEKGRSVGLHGKCPLATWAIYCKVPVKFLGEWMNNNLVVVKGGFKTRDEAQKHMEEMEIENCKVEVEWVREE